MDSVSIVSTKTIKYAIPISISCFFIQENPLLIKRILKHLRFNTILDLYEKLRKSENKTISQRDVSEVAKHYPNQFRKSILKKFKESVKINTINDEKDSSSGFELNITSPQSLATRTFSFFRFGLKRFVKRKFFNKSNDQQDQTDQLFDSYCDSKLKKDLQRQSCLNPSYQNEKDFLSDIIDEYLD